MIGDSKSFVRILLSLSLILLISMTVMQIVIFNVESNDLPSDKDVYRDDVVMSHVNGTITSVFENKFEEVGTSHYNLTLPRISSSRIIQLYENVTEIQLEVKYHLNIPGEHSKLLRITNGYQLNMSNEFASFVYSTPRWVPDIDAGLVYAETNTWDWTFNRTAISQWQTSPIYLACEFTYGAESMDNLTQRSESQVFTVISSYSITLILVYESMASDITLAFLANASIALSAVGIIVTLGLVFWTEKQTIPEIV